MKAIQKELGDMDDAPNEFEALQKKIDEAGMSTEALEKTNSELNKLKMMSPMSAEASVVRGYVDWMLSVPWKKRSKIKLDLANASKVLDTDHFGLEEVKERRYFQKPSIVKREYEKRLKRQAAKNKRLQEEKF
jgi:ATP-dependent Lon protease